MKKRIAFGLLVLLATILGLVARQRRAQAGATVNATVVVNINSDGSGTATGAMGNARNSTDTSEFIGCGIEFNGPNGSYWGCGAQNLTQSVACAVNMSDLNWAIKFPLVTRMLNPDSYINFSWKVVNGQNICTLVRIENSSKYAPKRLP